MIDGTSQHDTPLPADPSESLPSCCAWITSADKPSLHWINFWAATPSGDPEADYARGDRLGAEAVQYGRDTNQPLFIDCIILWMNYAVRSAGKDFGPLEFGFIHRAHRDDPNFQDRIQGHIYRAFPQLRH